MTFDYGFIAAWLRQKVSRRKHRVVPVVKVPEMSPGQRRLPKPGLAQVEREREESSARRIYALWGDE